MSALDRPRRLAAAGPALLLVVAAIAAIGLGARQVSTEGRAVERALREGWARRLDAESARARALVEAAEDRALALLAAAPADLAALRDSVRAAEASEPAPTGAWFLVRDDGALLHPAPDAVLRPPAEPGAVAAASGLLGEAARAAGSDVDAAIASYRLFLERYDDPPLPPQSRPLAHLAIATLAARHDRPGEAVAALSALETELAAEHIAGRPGIVAFYREEADALAAGLGEAAAALAVVRAELRAAGDRAAARRRFIAELHAWIGGRLQIELAAGAPDVADVSGGAAPGDRAPVRLVETIGGRPRRLVARTLTLDGRGYAAGFETDATAVARLVAPVVSDGGDGDGVALVHLGPGAAVPDGPGLVRRVAPGLEEERLALAFVDGDPLAAAAGRRRALLGVTLGATLLLGLAGVVLVWRQAARAIALAQARSDFVAAVSHELRTPLSLIRASVETLELGHVRDEDETRSYLRLVGRECERLSGLVGNVLDFARAERGEVRYTRSRHDPGELIGSFLETYAPGLEKDGFTIERAVDAELPAVDLDADAFRRALLNLVDNAVKYGGAAKWIEVAARPRAGGGIRVSVTDRGPGVPLEERVRILEPFERGARARDRAIRGTGLGLALTAQIARGHDGSLAVEDAPGGGARFVIELPGASAP